MILIAHRGLVNGPDKLIENHPDTIATALKLGFDCEIDVWRIDNKLYLGHDEPQYPVNEDFLFNPKFWIHAKNLDALYWLSQVKECNYFWHENDQYAITGLHYIWTCDKDNLTNKSVIVIQEIPTNAIITSRCYGICSDYSILISENINNRYE